MPYRAMEVERSAGVALEGAGSKDYRHIDDMEERYKSIADKDWILRDVGLITACLLIEAADVEAQGDARHDVEYPEVFGGD